MSREPESISHQKRVRIFREKRIVVRNQRRDVCGSELGFHPIEIEEKSSQFIFAPSFYEMAGQMLEEVAIIRAGVPAVTTFLAVSFQQAVVQLGEVFDLFSQVVELEVVKAQASVTVTPG